MQGLQLIEKSQGLTEIRHLFSQPLHMFRVLSAKPHRMPRCGHTEGQEQGWPAPECEHTHATRDHTIVTL